MRVISASSLVVTALLLLSACGSSQAATFNDTDVLNFALNLEVSVISSSFLLHPNAAFKAAHTIGEQFLPVDCLIWPLSG